MEENRERREEREITCRERQRKQERLRREQELRIKIAALSVLALFVFLLMIRGIVRWRESVREEERRKEQELEAREDELLSDSVLQYRDLVEYYAEEEGIEEYVPVLLAISAPVYRYQ